MAGVRGVPTRRCTCSGLRPCRRSPRRLCSRSCVAGGSMPTTSLEVLLRDRIKTPIGPALLILDNQGRLRALDWEDHEMRMLALLARFYGPGLTLNAHR